MFITSNFRTCNNTWPDEQRENNLSKNEINIIWNPTYSKGYYLVLNSAKGKQIPDTHMNVLFGYFKILNADSVY